MSVNTYSTCSGCGSQEPNKADMTDGVCRVCSEAKEAKAAHRRDLIERAAIAILSARTPSDHFDGADVCLVIEEATALVDELERRAE